MANEQKTAAPLFAAIENVTDRRTRAYLQLFDRRCDKVFTGVGHYERAKAWVDGWAEYLHNEWLHVRHTNAVIVEQLLVSLATQGIPEETLEKALQEVRNHAEA